MDNTSLTTIENQPAATSPIAAPVDPQGTTTAPVEQSVPEQVDWEAKAKAHEEALNATQAERDRLAQTNAAFEQRMAQDAVKAWQADEQQMLQDVQDMDPDDAIRHTADFYKQREAFYLQQYAEKDRRIHAERVNAFANDVIREHGLTEADKPRLFMAAQRDPNDMVAVAQQIKTERTQTSGEVAQLKAELEQLKRGLQAQGMRQSGAWNAGGTNVQTAPSDIPRGSTEHLGALLQGFGGRQ